MQSPEYVRSLSRKLGPFERVEPLICSWRVQSGLVGSAEKRNMKMAAREVVRNIRDAAWKLLPVERPRAGQVVILAYSATPATFGTLLPIMRQLAETGRPAFLVTTAKTQKYLKLKLHLGHADMRQIAAQISTSCQRATANRAREIADMLEDFFPGEDSAFWLNAGLAMRSATESWISTAKAIVTDSCSEAFRRGFILGAANAGVPTVILQHGLWGPNHFPIHAAKTFCWGPDFCMEAERYGVDRSSLFAVGCPRFDHLPALRRSPKSAEIYQAIGKHKGNPLVLVVSNAHAQPEYPEFYAQYFKTVEALAMSGCDLVVKPHPAERGLTAYQDNLSPAAFKRIRILPRELTLEQAITHSDVVYQGFSAAAIEAMMLGAPVLFEEGKPGAPKDCDFPEYGGGAWCSGPETVEACQTLACDGIERRALVDAQDAFLERAITNQGQATQAVCDRLEACGAPREYAGVD